MLLFAFILLQVGVVRVLQPVVAGELLPVAVGVAQLLPVAVEAVQLLQAGVEVPRRSQPVAAALRHSQPVVAPRHYLPDSLLHLSMPYDRE